jgi:3-oxoacyl-[acyl-carrier protein] reductase
VLRGMMKARWGRIVNITSVVGRHRQSGPGQLRRLQGRRGGPDQGHRGRGRDARHHVNCVAPWLHRHGHDRQLTPDQKAGLLTTVPLGRMGTPEEIAAAVVYLSSPEAAYVTGATLHINGGMAML